MDDWPLAHGRLTHWLIEQIDNCEGLLQLVGAAYGREPLNVDTEYGRVSYTQFELLYAWKQKKKVWIIHAQDDALRDRPLDQLDLPPAEVQVDPKIYQAERAQLQRTYYTKLKEKGLVRHKATTARDLEELLKTLKDHYHEIDKNWRGFVEELRDLHRGIEKRDRRIQFGIALIISLLLGLYGLFAWQSGTSTGQPTPVSGNKRDTIIIRNESATRTDTQQMRTRPQNGRSGRTEEGTQLGNSAMGRSLPQENNLLLNQIPPELQNTFLCSQQGYDGTLQMEDVAIKLTNVGEKGTVVGVFDTTRSKEFNFEVRVSNNPEADSHEAMPSRVLGIQQTVWLHVRYLKEEYPFGVPFDVILADANGNRYYQRARVTDDGYCVMHRLGKIQHDKQ